MDKLIRITGTAHEGVRPDRMRIAISLQGRDTKYGPVMTLAASRMAQLRVSLQAAGFDDGQLRTSEFAVEPVYEQRNDSTAQRLTGFRFRQSAGIELAADSGLLGKILTALAGCPADPTVEVTYTVADQQAVKQRLLARAVADARDKASIAAQAAGVRLGPVVGIEYSFDGTAISAAPMDMMMARCSADISVDMTPEDIDVSDTVTVTWGIAG